MTSLDELGYHPAYQPGPGETHYGYTHPHDRRPYTRGENIAGGLIVATAVAPGLVVGTVGLAGRVVWSLTRRFAARAILVGPVEQMARHKTLDTYINRADFIYTAYQYMQHRDRFRQSPGNSSQVLPAGSVSPGGIKESYSLSKKQVKRLLDPSPKFDYNPCRKGYVPRKVRGKWMCVPKSSKKSRSR